MKEGNPRGNPTRDVARGMYLWDQSGGLESEVISGGRSKGKQQAKKKSFFSESQLGTTPRTNLLRPGNVVGECQSQNMVSAANRILLWILCIEESFALLPNRFAIASKPISVPIAADDHSTDIVFLRHGESLWNQDKRFSGWCDIPLTGLGERQARTAGTRLRDFQFEFDEVHTSYLRRAIMTANLAMELCDQHWVPLKKSWELNERHYGALTGLLKAEAKEILGEERSVTYWTETRQRGDSNPFRLASWLSPRFRSLRRGYNTPPILMDDSHPYWPYDRRYESLGPDMPRGESLQMCEEVRRL